MIMAHMAHPWFEECIVVARKQANVYCEVSALFYRPWQFWNILIAAQEYRITERDKIFWGTDFPFSRVRGIDRRACAASTGWSRAPPAPRQQRDDRADPPFQSFRALVAWGLAGIGRACVSDWGR